MPSGGGCLAGDARVADGVCAELISVSLRVRVRTESGGEDLLHCAPGVIVVRAGDEYNGMCC